MSRAYAVAPTANANPPVRSPVARVSTPPHQVSRGRPRQPNPCYLERAKLLWPRLDQAKVRRIGSDPVRIAEVVSRRTSQPFDVIMAMLTRVSPIDPIDTSSGFDSGRADVVEVEPGVFAVHSRGARFEAITRGTGRVPIAGLVPRVAGGQRDDL